MWLAWGDGFGFYYGPYPTGEDIILYHSWWTPWFGSKSFTIQATAVCGNSTYDAELEVYAYRNRAMSNSLFLQFLERFPLLERLLNLI